MSRDPSRRDWPWLLVFAVFFLLVFHRFWSHTIIAYDALHLFAPHKAALLRGLRQGELYGWNPWPFLGLPFAATIEAGVFYPLNALFLLFEFGVAHRLFILAHYPLAGFGAFLWLRGRGLSQPSSLAGGLVFALSGFMVSEHAHVQIMLGLSWTPLALYFSDRARSDGRFAVAAGAVTAMQVLAGDPMSAAATALAVSVSLVVHGLATGRPVRGLGLAMLAGASAFALSAAQVLPTWELKELSSRSSGLAYPQLVQFSFHPAQLATIIWPTPYGLVWPASYFWGGFMLDNASSNLPWAASNYLGLPVLALAGVGLVAGRRPLRWWLLGACVLFLLLALGRYTPLYRLLAGVPVFSSFRYPSKYIGGLTLCLSFAAALGVEFGRERLRDQPAAVARAGLAYLALAAAAAAVAWFFWPAVMTAKSQFPPDSPLFAAGRAHLQAGWAQWTAVNLAAGLVLVLAGRGRLRPALAPAVLAAIIIADLGLGNVAIMPVGPSDLFSFTPLAARPILAGGNPLGRGRVYRRDWHFRDRNPALSGLPRFARAAVWECQTLKRNQAMSAGIEEISAYGPYQLLNGSALISGNLSSQVMALYNVRWLIVPPEQPSLQSIPSETVLLDQPNDFRVDRLKNIWPRAYWAPGARAAADEAEALRLLHTVDLTREAIITGGPAPAPAPKDAPGMKAAKVVSYEPDRVVVEADAPAAGWLVLSDRFYPGWRAALDGKPAEIRQANVLVRAVALPAGTHRVEFTFAPVLLRAGEWISGPAWVLLIGWALAARAFGNRGRKQYNEPLSSDDRRAADW